MSRETLTALAIGLFLCETGEETAISHKEHFAISRDTIFTIFQDSRPNSCERSGEINGDFRGGFDECEKRAGLEGDPAADEGFVYEIGDGLTDLWVAL